MRRRTFFSLLIISILINTVQAKGQQEYIDIIKNNWIKMSRKSTSEAMHTLLELDKGTIVIIESGLSSFNSISSYASEDENLKFLAKELSNLKISLRSVKDTELFSRAVISTVLVIAPDVGTGAGFIFDKTNKLIATNFHVTRGLKNVFVAFYDPNIQDISKLKFVSCEVINYSAKKDVAILRASSLPSNSSSFIINDSKILKVGEEIHTIGHPMSLTWTYSKGLITALRKKFVFGEDQAADVIQINASISPGNSGGPLLTDEGDLVGMITFASADIRSQNLNFAIAGSEIRHVLGLSSNEDTKVSTALKSLYGKKLFSLNTIMSQYQFYNIDEDKDGIIDYQILVNKTTKKEDFRLYRNKEYELEKGEKVIISMLCIDSNSDDIYDSFFMDTNSDNIFNIAAIDIDQDGQPDIMGTDEESKGIITKAWIL